MSGDILRRTPLHAEHRRLGAKLVSFAGFEMPVQYPTGIQAEHRAVRECAGLFDVSHMGEFEVSGAEALALLQELTPNDVARLTPGKAHYTAFLNDRGGVIDDLILYRLGEELFLLVVNASNAALDWEWLQGHATRFEVEVVDRSEETALLALHGPRAAEILEQVVDGGVGEVRPVHLVEGRVAGVSARIARTGYTGEDGFELFLPAAEATSVWRRLLEVGAPLGLLPVGLGARDTLRLEMGYPLHGNDLDPEHTLLEGGLRWVAKLDKGPFLGREVLLRQAEEGLERSLVGLRLLERGFPRAGYSVIAEGREIGSLTSGTVSPTLGEGIGMAYLPTPFAREGTRVRVRIRDRDLQAEVVRPPFYRGGSLRR